MRFRVLGIMLLPSEVGTTPLPLSGCVGVCVRVGVEPAVVVKAVANDINPASGEVRTVATTGLLFSSVDVLDAANRMACETSLSAIFAPSPIVAVTAANPCSAKYNIRKPYLDHPLF